MTDRALSTGGTGDWRYWLGEQRGTLLALAVFVVMFVIYTGNHQAGFSADVITTAANKGVLLALVAMAQTFVVLTAGIDLSIPSCTVSVYPASAAYHSDSGQGPPEQRRIRLTPIYREIYVPPQAA